MKIINAEKRHARDLAYLLNLAGEGIPEFLWWNMARDRQTPLDIGELRAARDEGSFSYTNAKICVERRKVLGMMISYSQPDPYDLSGLDEYPEIVRPIIKLEAKAPGSWYVNAVATFESERRRGVAWSFIANAQVQACAHGYCQMSLIVASENLRARKLYQRADFEVADAIPMVNYPGFVYSGDWLLMIKTLH